MFITVERFMKCKILMVAVFILAAYGVRAAPAAGLAEEITKELEFVDGLVLDGATTGRISQFDKAHRTLVNLGVTVDNLQDPKDKTLANLSIAYFYARMCESLPLLELSQSTNPNGINIDCVGMAEKFFGKAVASVNGGLPQSELGDTYFYIGLGYDTMRGFLAEIPGGNTSSLYEKAKENLSKAIDAGTSFGGAKAVLAKISMQQPDSRAPVIPLDTFLTIHRMLYIDRIFPKQPVPDNQVDTSSTRIIPKNEKNTYIDYMWRFSIQKPDETWQFATSTTKTNFKLTVSQRADLPPNRPPLTLVAHVLSPDEQTLALTELVTRSTQILIQAGYAVESQKEMDFKGAGAYEIVLTYSYKDLGLKSGEKPPAPETPAPPGSPPAPEAPASLDTRHYMFVVLSNNIEYILSFNSLQQDYSQVFPDLKMIANTFTPF